MTGRESECWFAAPLAGAWFEAMNPPAPPTVEPGMRMPVIPDRLIGWALIAIDVFECLVRREWRNAWAELRRPTDWG